jgi:dTDP-glucose 4,6-dehydratase
MRNRRVFLTGGTGFFGIWILETIRYLNTIHGLGIVTTVLSRHPGAFFKRHPHLAEEGWLRILPGEICSFPFPDLEVDDVIHAATPVSTTISPVDLWDTIVQGTRHTLDFAVAAKAKRFLLTSSGAIYGSSSGSTVPFDETLATAPLSTSSGSAYGLGKRAAEWLCTAYAEKAQLECKIARCFSFAGPFQPLDRVSALGCFIDDAFHNPTIRINGDGTAVRSYQYATDLVVGLFKVLVDGRAGEPYNIGSDEGVTMLELADLVRRIVGCEKQIVVAHQPCLGRGANCYLPSTEKIRRELGLPVPIPLSSALHKTIAWHRTNLTAAASFASGHPCAPSSRNHSETS